MKKLITMMVAVMIMAFSMLTAFASVDSPVGTTVPETKSTTTPVSVPDTGATSPKTGYDTASAKSASSDILAYTLIAASVIGCGLASVALVKAAKKNYFWFLRASAAWQVLFALFEEGSRALAEA